MEVQAITKGEEYQPRFPGRPPFPYMERLVLGAVVGAVGGILAGAIGFDMEAAAICSAVLALFFALIGASCGVVSRLHGWAAVRPIAWAIAGGIALHIDRPSGWIIGGVIGGVINGVLHRSIASTAKGALVGACLGTLGWAVILAYLLGVLSLLNYLGGQ